MVNYSGIQLKLGILTLNLVSDKPKDREDLLLDCLLDLKKDLNARKPTISRLEQAIAEDIVMTNDVSQVST